MWTLAGSSARNCGSSSLTASATAIVLVPGWRWMPSVMARCSPSARVEPRAGARILDAVDRPCRARSSRTGAPLRYATIIFWYCSAFISWPVACSVKACVRTDDRAGRHVDVPVLAAPLSTSLMPIWRAASACGSSCACTAYFWLPSTCTCATPLTCEMRCAMRVSAYSSSVHGGSVVDVTTR